ncbi:OmpA family protein [Paralysiella testudinis]|uniref:OmpA family protein n=1 Tax=Paralysiella testudinis TaxID=2809020 RepID=A0A892ZFR2_9NEIS|nr:OmpA family protein [Paralysiella testudinis]QRQ82275.1 OmpA family protein [Paralysiella testudinis]
MFRKINLLVTALVLITSGCAISQNQPAEQWQNFSSTSAQVQPVAENKAGAVFIRPANGLAGEAVNVFVDGQYLASLLPGGYRQLLLCPKDSRLSAAFTNVNTHYKEKQQGKLFRLTEGDVSYFEITQDAQGQPSLVQIDQINAQALLQNAKEQQSGLSRVGENTECTTVAVQTYTLNDEVFFAFDQHQAAGMVDKDHQKINIIASHIRQNVNKIQMIVIEGYTDPVGNDSYNHKLSQARANAVKQQFLKLGISADLLQARGKGSTNLVINNCANQHPHNKAMRNMCNQPNRRVMVIVHGKHQ